MLLSPAEEIAFHIAKTTRVEPPSRVANHNGLLLTFMHFLASLKRLAFAAAGCAALLLAVSLGAAPGASKAKIPNCSCVAFRLDDIRDYFLNHVQVEVMEVFDRRNVSLTVGVIGNYFGSDPMIANHVKGRAGEPLFEVANHGLDHENFAVLGRGEQAELVQRTNEKIFDLLGVRPEVFIAPYNIVNEDTFAAMQENGMRYITTWAATPAFTGFPRLPSWATSTTTTLRG
jgi:peptidoglycan/xylan/chitin deacetylase (PgdA/CDA1 family)